MQCLNRTSQTAKFKRSAYYQSQEGVWRYSDAENTTSSRGRLSAWDLEKFVLDGGWTVLVGKTRTICQHKEVVSLEGFYVKKEVILSAD